MHIYVYIHVGLSHHIYKCIYVYRGLIPVYIERERVRSLEFVSMYIYILFIYIYITLQKSTLQHL